MAHFVYPVPANAQPATAYPAQPAYVAAAAPQAAYGTATPRAGQAYESYPAAHATTQYAYTTRTPVAVTPAVSYDQPKAYYQPAPTAATAYTAAEAHYQTAKPVFTTGAGFTAQRQTAQPKAPAAVQVTTTSQNYTYTASTTPAVNTYSTTYNTPSTTQSTISGLVSLGVASSAGLQTGYDAAVYSAASSYYQQQQAAKAIGTWAAKKPGIQTFKPKPKGPPKTPQLHYCDVCKISCAGPQTYREHLEGQKHKKKEQAVKGTTTPAVRGGHNQLRCELCDVTCTGADAYAAHIRGAKHQKVVKLHTKLGKPIPSTDPVLVTATGTATVTVAKTTAPSVSSSSYGVSSAAKTTAKTVSSGGTSSSFGVVKKVVATPKITFVGGTTLRTTGSKTEEVKAEAPKPAEPMQTSSSDDLKDDETLNILGEKDVAPVGHEYIEEVRNEQGKTISFNCKLCECKFNDPNAKEMHLKGRRHRLQYKKKVDPNLQVEVKPSIRARKVQEDKLRRQAQKEEFWRRREQEDRWREEMRMEEEMYWEQQRRYDMEYFHRGPMGMMGPRAPFMGGPGPMMRKPESSDDRHVSAKHAAIYPTEVELQAVQTIVSACERALKQVSDFLAESDGPAPKVEEKKEVKKDDASADSKQAEKKDDPANANRVLKGVMRVGVLAKGLLLHGDLNVSLVVLCSEKPTRTLLECMADSLPKQLATVTEDKYEVKRCVEEAAIIVTAEKEPFPSCTITLTSPIMREANLPEGETVSVKDPPDVLDRQKCLAALAALRHAKWFQARATGLPSCVMVIRILRDLCQRVPTWSHLNQWAMELLVEKCVSSGGPNMSPGDALRRVFECIASGVILPGGPGLYDPCEKEPTDALASLTNQMREDLTASAQHALRLLAFRQVHKVLGMDPLPPPRFQQRRFGNPRKRRHTNSGEGLEDGGEKKEKKEGEETGGE